MQLRAGTSLGKYRILSELGRGGMGIVLLAEDGSLGRRVALKVLSLTVLADERLAVGLRREAKAIAGLAHPNVVHLHAFEIIDGLPVLEMEYVEGGSLSRRLVEEVVTVHDVVRYSHGVASALAYCHGLHTIHRDVKPSNILIDRFGTARLADFGIATLADNAEEFSVTRSWSTGFQGTPRYAPPEAWDGERPSEAWDMYSLGAVMFESLAGEPPYKAESPLQLAKVISTGPPPPVRTLNPRVSPELDNLVSRMLSRDVVQRPESAECVLQSLQECPEWEDSTPSDNSTVIAARKNHPSRATSRRRKRARSKGPAYLALMTVVVVLAIAGAWWLTAERSVKPGGLTRAAKAPIQRQTRTSMYTARSLKAFLGQTKGAFGAHSVVFDARFEQAGEGDGEQWLVAMGDDNGPERILMATETRVGLMTLSPMGGDGYEAEGHWGAYSDVAGTVFRHGSVQGNLRWRDGREILSGVLTFRANEDGTESKGIVVAWPADSGTTDTAFLYATEASEYVFPMLVNELAPRTLAWPDHVLEVLPTFSDGWIFVPIMGGAGTSMTVDGILDEPVWRRSGPNVASLAGYPERAMAALRVVALEDGLALGLRCKAGASSENARLDVIIATAFPIPLSAGESTRLTLSLKNGEIHVEPSGLPAPGAQVQSRVNAGVLEIEGRIPFALLGLPEAVASDSIWRLNALLRDEDRDGKTLCQWGFRDFEAVHHGLLLRFQSASPKSQ